MAKEKSNIGSMFKNFIVTLLLLIVLLLTLAGGTIFLDIIGFINLSKILPKSSQIAKVPYISSYLDYSYHQHLTEEDRIKETMNRYREILENRRKEMDVREKNIDIKEKELKGLEEKLLTMENTLMDKDTELNKKEKRLSEMMEHYASNEKNIEKFALIYTSMDPVAVSKIIVDADLVTIAKIFELMENKKIAGILDALAEENPQKVVELVNLMTATQKEN